MNEMVMVLNNLTVLVTHVGNHPDYEEELAARMPYEGLEVNDIVTEYKVQLDIPKCSRFSTFKGNIYAKISLYRTDAGITCKAFELEETDLNDNKIAYSSGIKAKRLMLNSRTRIYV